MIRIDANSPIPPFEQLRAQLNLHVASGRLRPGDRLPPIRKLAIQLDLSNGTVARAYRELEYSGVIVGRGRKGTFVSAEPPAPPGPQEVSRRLEEAATKFVFEADQLGVEHAAVREALEAALRSGLDQS